MLQYPLLLEASTCIRCNAERLLGVHVCLRFEYKVLLCCGPVAPLCMIIRLTSSMHYVHVCQGQALERHQNAAQNVKGAVQSRHSSRLAMGLC